MVCDNNDATLIHRALKESRIIRDGEPTHEQLSALLDHLPEHIGVVGDKADDSV